MINEFFKSIFRTLGRIFAYLVLGILAYLILSWFGLPNVKADTINSPTYRIESITQNFAVGTSANATSGITLPNVTSDYGVQWLPVSGTSSSWSYIPLKKSSYSVDLQFVIGVGTQYQYNQLLNTMPQLTIIVDRTTQATCDGTTTYSRLGNFTLVQDNVTYYYVSFRYQCSRLDVTNDYTNVMARVLIQSMYQQSFTYLHGVTINAFTFIDLNNITAGDTAIINANNQNAQRIIDAMANVWNNVDEAKAAIEAMESQLHSDMSRMIAEAEEANEAMLDEITSESDSDTTILFEIANQMPSATPITNIISLPLTILNTTINSLGGTCQSYSINTGSLLGNHTWTFPCLNISQYFTGFSYGGYNLWQLIDLMICLYMGYEILLLIVHAYHNISNLNDTFGSLYKPKGGK